MPPRRSCRSSRCGPSAPARRPPGLLLATDAADYLVRRGLPFRDAHEVIGRMVRELLAAGRDFDDLSLAEWRAYSELFGDDVTRSGQRAGVGAGAPHAAVDPPRRGTRPRSTRRGPGWRDG